MFLFCSVADQYGSCFGLCSGVSFRIYSSCCFLFVFVKLVCQHLCAVSIVCLRIVFLPVAYSNIISKWFLDYRFSAVLVLPSQLSLIAENIYMTLFDFANSCVKTGRIFAPVHALSWFILLHLLLCCFLSLLLAVCRRCGCKLIRLNLSCCVFNNSPSLVGRRPVVLTITMYLFGSCIDCVAGIFLALMPMVDVCCVRYFAEARYELLLICKTPQPAVSCMYVWQWLSCHHMSTRVTSLSYC